ncbi:hypothetical protein CE91St44_13860 [Oscillospiraceae bacterium]|nr:hypothetical protein CE91St44_13860 [Oscillospiraceae bacterium]
MGYVRATKVLPDDIIRLIQTYVEGELIYIPKQNKKRWGTNTETKEILQRRNDQIFADFLEGMSILEISQKYFLVEKSVTRIIRQKKL